MKNILIGMIFCGLLLGCASLKETCKEVWGSSIKHLEAARSSGQSTIIALNSDKAFDKIEDILAKSEAMVYLKDPAKRYMAAMHFPGHVDTTEVGIFLTPQENGETKVEVASMSPSLVDQVARFLFEELKANKGEKK